MLKRFHERILAYVIGFDFFGMMLSGGIAVVLHFFLISPEKRTGIPNVFGWFPVQEDRLYIYAFLVLLISCLQILIFFVRHDYDKPRWITGDEQTVLHPIPSIAVNFILVTLLLYFLRLTDVSRLVLVYFFLLAAVGIPIGKFFLYSANFFHGRRIGKKTGSQSEGRTGVTLIAPRILLMGFPANQLHTFLTSIQEQNFFGLEISAVFLSEMLEKKGPSSKLEKSKKNHLAKSLKNYAKETRKIEILETSSHVHRFLAAEKADMVLIYLPFSEKSARHANQSKKIRAVCNQVGVEVLFVAPSLERESHFDWKVKFLDRFLIMKERLVPLDRFSSRLQKRILDLGGSSLILLLCIPFFLLISLWIKWDSPGPIFFVQKRIGQDGKLFSLYKFRSMRVQQESDSDRRWGKFADARTTRSGVFLRRFGLDELPQFWNVFLGSMSIVGPRPERPHFVRRFRTDIRDYMFRHAVKSGITGLAQIKGYRGDTSIHKRLEYDIRYIEHWTIFLDIWIMLCTPFVIHKNVNG